MGRTRRRAGRLGLTDQGDKKEESGYGAGLNGEHEEEALPSSVRKGSRVGGYCTLTARL